MITKLENEKFVEMLFQKQEGKQILDIVIEWIENELIPEDIFDEAALIEWAEDNGYIKGGF